MDDEPLRGAAALQAILRYALPILAEAWDGGVERVAFISECEGVRFIGRAEAIDRVVRSAASFVGDGARVARKALASGPARNRAGGGLT